MHASTMIELVSNKTEKRSFSLLYLHLDLVRLIVLGPFDIRLDLIRASGATTHGQGHRTPSTRDSSPSRSVQFVDYIDGETELLDMVSGSTRDGNGNRKRKVSVAIPPSFTVPDKDHGNENGRTSVDSPVEKWPAATISASRALVNCLLCT